MAEVDLWPRIYGTHVFHGFLTPVQHTTIFPSNWLIFPDKLSPLVEWRMSHWLKTPGLTACIATNLATGAGCFSLIDLVHWWKTNDACRIDFCQTSERKFAEPGFELKTPWLTACIATVWATGARPFLVNKPFGLGHLLHYILTLKTYPKEIGNSF